MKKEKSLDIELMRAFAAFFVIFNHTGRCGYQMFSEFWPFEIRFVYYAIPSVFCKFAVPLFFMVFGALMLNREQESWTRTLGRMANMALLLTFWSAYYYLADVLHGDEVFRPGDFFLRLITKGLDFPLWYIYCYIGMLATLPLLQRFAQGMKNRDFLYLFALYFLFSCLRPTLECVLGRGEYALNQWLNPGWICADILFYPCLGYFLRHRIRDFWNGRRLALLWLCNLGGILLTVLITGLRIWQTGQTVTEDFHLAYTCINAAAMFVSCQYLCDRVALPLWIRKTIISLGSCAFGIYVLHYPIMTRIGNLEDSLLLQRILHINSLPSILIYCLGIYLLCYAITLLMKKIPGVKALVKG